MPLGETDNLEIGVGLTGFENVEARLERLNTLLETAATSADKAFKTPSSSGKELANRLTDIDRLLTSTASKYASFGRAGAAGFEQINKQQLESIDKIVKLQARLRDLDKERASTKSVSAIAAITKEADNLEKQLTKIIRSSHSLQSLDILAKLQTRIASANSGGEKTIFSGAASIYTPGADKEMQKAQANIARLQSQRKKWEEEYTTHVNRETDKQFRTKAVRAQNYVKDLLSGLRQVAKEESKVTLGAAGRYIGRSTRGPIHDVFAEVGLGGLSGALGPVAAIGAAGIAVKKGIDLAQVAIERASEQARANRVLASSAAEASISIEKLNSENKKFADLAALSEVKATSTVARITQLATLTQDPNRISKLVKGFADLGAARGLDATGIETVVQQIITGQDEGYKKLLLPNPSQLQAKFGRENNRSVASLTAVEKAKIFQAEFLKKAELFNGAAEARLASVDGRAAKLEASFENLANILSTRFANSYETIKFVEALTGAFSSLNSEVDDLASKLERGINIDDAIKSKSSQNPLLRGGQIIANTAGALVASPLDFLFGGALNQLSGKNITARPFGQGTQQTYNDLYASTSGANEGLREDFARQQINATVLQREQNRRIENERRIALAGERGEEDRLRKRDIESRRIGNVFSDPRANAAQVISTLEEVRRYSGPAKQEIDKSALEAELQKRVETRDTGLDRGRNLVDIQKQLREQVTKEFQAQVDVSNLPLFDEEDKKKFIESGEKILEDLAKKARDLVDGVRDSMVESLASKTENPFIKLFSDAENAAESARRKFAQLGPQVADAMAKIAQSEAQSRLAIATFESSDRALKFTQQARKEGLRPYTQTNAFQRRLGAVQEETDFTSERLDLENSLKSLDFYGRTQVGGKPRKLREAFLRQQYGDNYQDLRQGARGSRDEKDAYRDIGVRVKQAIESASAFDRIDTQGTGIIGQGKIARSQLDRLPTEEELLPRLRVPGRAREEAQILLRRRAQLSRDVGAGREEEFNQYVANQKFLETARTDATERAKLLESDGGALTNKTRLDKFLSITDELGADELTPELREKRIKALDARAEIESQEKETAAAQMETITKFITTLQTQIEQGGLKVSLAETPVVNVNVNASGVEAQLEQRPTENRGR